MGNELGSKIKKQRIQLGFSLRKVCGAVVNEDGKPISVSYLNDIEQGYRKSPSGKIIAQIASALEMDRQELLSLVGKMDPDIEDAVNEDAKVGVLFRQIAEKSKIDKGIINWLSNELNKKKEK